MYPEQDYQEQDTETAFLEDAALTARSEEEIQARILQKTLAMFSSLGRQAPNVDNVSFNTSTSFSASFKKLTPEQQAAKIKETIEKNTTYGSTLNKLKSFTLEKLNSPEILTTSAEVQTAAMRVREMALGSETKLHELYFAIVKLCEVAIKNSKGWMWSGQLAKPLQELQDAVMNENGEFRLGNFFSNWENDAHLLSAKALQEDELELEKTICKAAANVYQENFLEMSMQLDQTMERSRIMKHTGQPVQLKDPSKEPSLSTVIAENFKVVKTQEIKAQKIKADNNKSMEEPVANRLKQYMTDKAIYCIKTISELYNNIESTVNILKSRVPNNQGPQNNGPGFFSTAAKPTLLTPIGQEFLESEIKNLRVLRKVIYALATTNNAAVDFILSKYLENIGAENKQFELIYKFLAQLKSDTDGMNDQIVVKNPLDKWGFVSVCYKVGSEYGCIFPCDKELSDLLSQAKAKRLNTAPAFPSSQAEAPQLIAGTSKPSLKMRPGM